MPRLLSNPQPPLASRPRACASAADPHSVLALDLRPREESLKIIEAAASRRRLAAPSMCFRPNRSLYPHPAQTPRALPTSSWVTFSNSTTAHPQCRPLSIPHGSHMHCGQQKPHPRPRTASLPRLLGDIPNETKNHAPGGKSQPPELSAHALRVWCPTLVQADSTANPDGLGWPSLPGGPEIVAVLTLGDTELVRAQSSGRGTAGSKSCLIAGRLTATAEDAGTGPGSRPAMSPQQLH